MEVRGTGTPTDRPRSATGRASSVTVLLLVILTISLDVLPAPAARGAPSGRASGAIGYRAFSDPRPVTITAWSGSAMEPFVSPSGRYLLFNTSNVAPSVPALQYATRTGPRRFSYRGPVGGANQTGSLSGTPSMDAQGNLYFVSDRSYAANRSTVYAGRFASGAVTGLHAVAGVTTGAVGQVDFDVSVSPDGGTLYVSVGQFGTGSSPSSSSLVVFDRSGDGFAPDPARTVLLGAVNRPWLLDYAASVSADGLELYFTRADPQGGVPTIERAVRTSVASPFGHVQRVAAITGFAEAPSLSTDGRTLYFHQRLAGGGFVIRQVTRH